MTSRALLWLRQNRSASSCSQFWFLNALHYSLSFMVYKHLYFTLRTRRDLRRKLKVVVTDGSPSRRRSFNTTTRNKERIVVVTAPDYFFSREFRSFLSISFLPSSLLMLSVFLYRYALRCLLERGNINDRRTYRYLFGGYNICATSIVPVDGHVGTYYYIV